MSNVTLILTRVPFNRFYFGRRGGRWGRMLVVTGPIVQAASFEAKQLKGSGHTEQLNLKIDEDHTKVHVSTDGRTVEECRQFDTMERFQDRSMEKNEFFMQVKPQHVRGIPFYPLDMLISSTVRDIFNENKISDHNGGRCLKVREHGYAKQGARGSAGILIHEAPHVGFLTGCIAPGRKQGNKMEQGSSRKAMSYIFQKMGGFQTGTKARLIVLDW